MIVQEHFTLNERVFIRTYSDSVRYVVRDGVEYTEACDPVELGRTYTEGEHIPYDSDEIADKAEAYDILMGEIE